MEGLSLHSGYIYTMSSPFPEEGYISEQRLSLLYYGGGQRLFELELTEDYCIYLSKRLDCCEVHIFKARHQSDTDALKRMLDNRARVVTRSEINPNRSELLGSGAREYKLFSVGCIVILLTGSECEAVYERLRELL